MPWKSAVSNADLQNARALHELEKVYPLDDYNLFRGSLYAAISAVQNYTGHMGIYREMLGTGMDTPSSIVGNRDRLRKMMSRARYPNSKEEKIYGLAEWWTGADLPRLLIEDAGNGRAKEFELRDELAKQAPGFGWKCSSMLMRMCGYENVVPIDTWVLTFLKERGFDIPEYITIGGAKGGPYKEQEVRLSRIARRHDLSPGIFQLALWVKYSGWEPASE